MVTRSNGADLSAYGALDTCCTSTLIGEETLRGLVASGLEFLPTNDTKLFRGIGKELVASKQAGHLRCRIIGIEETVRFALHVVEGDIPLLLSLDTQIRLGVELDLAKKELRVQGKSLPFRRCGRGHPVIQLSPPEARTPLGTCFSDVDTLNLSEAQ